MDYRIIASDLDGTLLGSNGMVSEENSEAIKDISQKDVYFVPASGRTLAEMPPELVANENIRYLIYSNGAVVLDKITGDKITLCIPDDIKNTLFDLFFTCDCHVTVRFDGKGYVDKNKQTEQDFEYYSINPEHKGVILDYAVYSDNFEELCKNAKDVEVISVFFKHAKDRDRCIALIKKCATLGYANIYENNLEIFSLVAGKGNALKALARKLGIDIEKTVACGDSDNDVEMLRAAGLGLVPSNAPERIKSVGDRIVCSNDEHIAKFVFENYIEQDGE